MSTSVSVPLNDRFEWRELAEQVNRDMLPIDSVEISAIPTSQEVEAVIGSMKKFVENMH